MSVFVNGFECVFRPLFDYIDDDDRFVFKNNNLGKNLQEFLTLIVCFLLGLPTLGVFWPKFLRQAILSAGMSKMDDVSVENSVSNMVMKELQEENERLKNENITLQSELISLKKN